MTQKKGGDWLKTAIIGAAVCFAAREFMKGMVVLAEGNVGAARELKIGMVAIEEVLCFIPNAYQLLHIHDALKTLEELAYQLQQCRVVGESAVGVITGIATSATPMAVHDRVVGASGQQGVYDMQQDYAVDAEECWTNLLYILRERLKGQQHDNGTEDQVVDRMLGIGTRLKLKCEESGEELELDTTRSYMLKCNIDGNTNHLHEGLLLGLVDDRERHSAALGRTALFKGSSVITSLPAYLTVQMVRFFYKAAAQQKAKVLRKVSFGVELDVYDFCAPELKLQLDGPRAALKEHQDRLVDEKKKNGATSTKPKGVAARSNEEGPKQALLEATGHAAASSASADVAEAASVAADVDMADAAADALSAAASSAAAAVCCHKGGMTGKYELCGLLTHTGRSADSGHYVSWVKQLDGRWILFDDDTLSFKKEEDILALSGGGDWHMAYMLVYRAILAP
ncbi:hypothetical protein CEUSTIGMA_g11007.t1 [Chlamydomonas eustigma]|uniref:ubiquitinyl hydrolase 1 n=1 Tax=Chlamydomonas eustigma TaxID=1157962 RepID=A0A250XL12_9CHLO|nr:hypothetical protein CEUSTIGMA_g11007.t1 [Chlamydomonas eustigma]|eukprot:GAX83582.1 hypothetical protein CEUSTIGMA_g11007.t1 [Chlamydomonas eustigma]